MRPDMGKIAVDAYRFHDWGDGRFSVKQPKHKNQVDERPTKESMSRTKYGSKGLGENLNPLYRWLRKQVGRKWDDVYSEIVTTLGGGYANLEHIKGHVLSEVESGEILMRDGWPHAKWRYFSSRDGDPWHELDRKDLYVDDKGMLRMPPKKMAPSEKRSFERGRRPKIIMLDGMTAAAKIDGTWFAADLAPIPTYETKVIDYTRSKYPYTNRADVVMKKAVERKNVTDILLDRLNRRKRNGRWVHPDLPYHERENAPYDVRNVYAPSIRTMSKKEIKQRIPEELR